MDRGTLLAGRYLLEEVLGNGGMGRVWRAQDQLLDRPVAVKVLAPHLVDDERSSGRLRAEATRAAKVRHPNVVQVLDVVFEEQVAAIVLQLVDGPDLQAHVPAGGLSPDEALRLLDGIAAGLAAVHGAGVVHRDVTPRNVLLDAGVPRLTDFGIARSVIATSTATQTVRGSVGYLSPEQASGGSVGPAADVYALACLTTFLLTGRPPFEAESPVGVVHQHMTAEAPDVRTRSPEVPEAVAAGIAAALAKDPDRRPADVASFMAAIGRPLPAAVAGPTAATAVAGSDETAPTEGHDATQVLPGLATTRLVEPMPGAVVLPDAPAEAAPAEAAPDGRGAQRVLVVGGIALLALLAVLALTPSADVPEAAAPTAAPSELPSSVPSPTPESAPSPEPTVAPPTPQEAVASALAALRSALADQRSGGAIDEKASSKLDDELGKVEDKLGQGKARDAEKELAGFVEEIAKRAEKGEVTAQAQDVLLAAAADLESALARLEDTDAKRKQDDDAEDEGEDDD